jgi:hypothetical protein
MFRLISEARCSFGSFEGEHAMCAVAESPSGALWCEPIATVFTSALSVTFFRVLTFFGHPIVLSVLEPICQDLSRPMLT